MNCPHCDVDHGHYSTVTYIPIEDNLTEALRAASGRSRTQNKITEAYWFCHICAKLVYETDAGFVPPKE